MKFYLSTTADLGPSYENPENPGPSAALAAEYGLGLEIADFCICSNLDERYQITAGLIRRKQELVPDLLMHAPFNELCPAAIDPWVRDVARRRYLQIFREAERFGAKKLVVHSGFDPMLYRREYFIPESINFWKELMESCPEGLILVLENVMETEPSLLREICEGTAHPRFQLCLDVGHANLMPVPVIEWIRAYGDRVTHFHLHNNEGKKTQGQIAAADDLHHALGNGILDMDAVLQYISRNLPEATLTVETVQLEASLQWLEKRGYIRK